MRFLYAAMLGLGLATAAPAQTVVAVVYVVQTPAGPRYVTYYVVQPVTAAEVLPYVFPPWDLPRSRIRGGPVRRALGNG